MCSLRSLFQTTHSHVPTSSLCILCRTPPTLHRCHVEYRPRSRYSHLEAFPSGYTTFYTMSRFRRQEHVPCSETALEPEAVSRGFAPSEWPGRTAVRAVVCQNARAAQSIFRYGNSSSATRPVSSGSQSDQCACSWSERTDMGPSFQYASRLTESPIASACSATYDRTRSTPRGRRQLLAAVAACRGPRKRSGPRNRHPRRLSASAI